MTQGSLGPISLHTELRVALYQKKMVWVSRRWGAVAIPTILLPDSRIRGDARCLRALLAICPQFFHFIKGRPLLMWVSGEDHGYAYKCRGSGATHGYLCGRTPPPVRMRSEHHNIQYIHILVYPYIFIQPILFRAPRMGYGCTGLSEL